MSNEVLQTRIYDFKEELKQLKQREKIIKSCGFQHRVPFDFFQLSPKEFDDKIKELWEKDKTITQEEYFSYNLKTCYSDGIPFALTIPERIEKFILGYSF